MMKRLQATAWLAAAGALLAVPAAGQAHHDAGHTKGGNGKSAPGKVCAKKSTVNKGFSVKGTLVSYTADNPVTQSVNEESLTLTVTHRSRHARRAGLTDSDGAAAGLQYKVNDDVDPFSLRRSEFEAGESPAAGDRVHIIGKVAVTKKKCAPAGASLEDRYGAVNVRKVKIGDAD